MDIEVPSLFPGIPTLPKKSSINSSFSALVVDQLFPYAGISSQARSTPAGWLGLIWRVVPAEWVTDIAIQPTAQDDCANSSTRSGLERALYPVGAGTSAAGAQLIHRSSGCTSNQVTATIACKHEGFWFPR
jgi:hypothetical protein